MPNHLVFNNIASQLQAQISGQDSNGIVRKILTDSDGRLQIGPVTVAAAETLDIRPLSGATDSIMIANTEVTITAQGLDIRNLSGTTDSVMIANTVVTVAAETLDIRPLSGATDSVMIANTEVTITAEDLDIRNLSGTTDSVMIANTIVTVTAEAFDIRPLSAATDSINLSGRLFTESNMALDSVTDSGAIFVQNTSENSMYSFFVYNTGSNTLTVALQISPIDDDEYYLFDGGIESSVALAPGDKTVLVAEKYLKYTRLFYDTGGEACTFVVYYNAHV
ncbi:MAG: hypothetical protein GX066_05190 [Clostridiaceae bacterium]|nr:hypothetical protein [Clostridiaceae bacterium]